MHIFVFSLIFPQAIHIYLQNLLSLIYMAIQITISFFFVLSDVVYDSPLDIYFKNL